MFDREQFREEIAAQLKDVPHDKQQVFAVRSAMRVLPLLAVRKDVYRTPFSFWKKDRINRHLLDVLLAYCVKIELFFTGTYSSNHLSSASLAAYEASAGYADYAIHAANPIDATDAAVHAVYAVHTAANYSSNADVDSIIEAILHDLTILQTTSAKELLEQSLWTKSIPKKWQLLISTFKIDVISLNAGFSVWLEWYEDRLQGKPIDIEFLKQWNNIPREINAQSVEKVNAYLKNLKEYKYETIDIFGHTIVTNSYDIDSPAITLRPLNRVRAIFIGYGEAGKTSLIRALHGEEVTKGTEAMTCGIEIRDWDIPNTEIKAHFWDFGGQVVFHSTHKFFLRSSCVYIIVINARADINNSEQAEYWLDHVKVFGGSAPVLLVANKADEAQIHFQEESLKQKYPNIKGFYSVSCTKAKTSYCYQFETFKQALVNELRAIEIHQMLFTSAQANVLNELRQNSSENVFLSENDFNQICDKHGISDDGELNRDWLVDIFDKLGVMLHFEELKTFHNAYMLNPRWLTHGVYTLMNAKQARLNDSDMVKILANAKVEDEYQHLLSYPADKCLFISKAMQRFKLCYPLRNGENAMLIPALLPDEVDLTGFKNLSGLNDMLQFEFAFSGFLPRNLIGEFMVSRYEEIKDNLQSQRGAVFKSRSLQAEALVEADYHRRLIIMQVVGRDAKEYITILYDAMLMIFGDLALEYREWVVLPPSACLDKETLGFNRKVGKAPYQQLLACARKKQTVYIAESGLSYDLGKVLGFILSKEKQAEIINNFYDSSPTFNHKNEVDMSEGKTTIKAKNYIAGDVKDGGQVAGRNIINKTGANNADVNALLEQLLDEIKALNGKVPPAQSQVIEKMASRADGLIAESKSETPDKEWYEVSLKGILEAAKAIGTAADPVLAVAKKLSPLLLSL